MIEVGDIIEIKPGKEGTVSDVIKVEGAEEKIYMDTGKPLGRYVQILEKNRLILKNYQTLMDMRGKLVKLHTIFGLHAGELKYQTPYFYIGGYKNRIKFLATDTTKIEKDDICFQTDYKGR